MSLLTDFWANFRLSWFRSGQHRGAMSLNRVEQIVFDYVQENPEELGFWREKVVGLQNLGDREIATAQLAELLWDYVAERSPNVSSIGREVGNPQIRSSMRNLAELLIRLWWPPAPPRRARPIF